MYIQRFFRHKLFHPMNLDGVCRCKCFFCWDTSWQSCICNKCSGIGHTECRNAKRNRKNYVRIQRKQRKLKHGFPGHRGW